MSAANAQLSSLLFFFVGLEIRLYIIVSETDKKRWLPTREAKKLEILLGFSFHDSKEEE